MGNAKISELCVIQYFEALYRDIQKHYGERIFAESSFSDKINPLVNTPDESSLKMSLH